MAMAPTPPEPLLSDGVVTLRPWGEEGDAEAIAAACNDPQIATFLDRVPSPYTKDDAEAYLELTRAGWEDGTMSGFAIVEDGRPVGSIGVRWLDGLDEGTAEVGYWVAGDARGRGICTRALRLVSAWAIEAGAARLQLRADSDNRPSNRVAEKAGFTREGVLRSSRYNTRLRRRIDFVMYSLLPSELG
jgi:RimJ/RimL family protein N-acetyltransferase